MTLNKSQLKTTANAWKQLIKSLNRWNGQRNVSRHHTHENKSENRDLRDFHCSKLIFNEGFGILSLLKCSYIKDHVKKLCEKRQKSPERPMLTRCWGVAARALHTQGFPIPKWINLKFSRTIRWYAFNYIRWAFKCIVWCHSRRERAHLWRRLPKWVKFAKAFLIQ